jgi:hypothetical protein
VLGTGTRCAVGGEICHYLKREEEEGKYKREKKEEEKRKEEEKKKSHRVLSPGLV